MTLNIQDLKNKREDILKAEICALMFNLGKSSVGFTPFSKYFNNSELPDFCERDNNNQKKSFSYKDYWVNYFTQEIDISSYQNIRKFIGDIQFTIDSEIVSIIEISKNSQSSKNIIKKTFFRGCESINSGVEKGHPDLSLDTLYITNVFGSNKSIIDKRLLDNARINFFTNLENSDELKIYNNDNNYITNLIKLRKVIKDELSNMYRKILSDSRIPVNDVSLRDQAYMTASLFKSTLTGGILGNNISNIKSNPSSIKRSIMGVIYDKLALKEKATKLGLLKGYDDLINDLDDKVKNYIETEIVLGNEIYKDETGIYFLVPECCKGEQIDIKGDKKFYKLNNYLKDINDEIKKIFSDESKGEVIPEIVLTEPSRGTTTLGYLKQNIHNFIGDIKIDYNEIDDYNRSKNGKGICKNCKIRLYENEETNLCEICESRKDGVVKDWLKNTNEETIWLEELKDKSNRVGLISVKFELEKWLNGEFINSLIVQNKDKNDINLFFNSIRINTWDSDVNKDYLDGAIHRLAPRDITSNFLFNYSLGNELTVYINKHFGKNKIDFENQDIYWNKLDDSDLMKLAEILFQLLVRKHPSPARLRRVWESTEIFLNDIQDSLGNICKGIRQKEVLEEIEQSTKVENIQKKGIFEQNNKKIEEYVDGKFLQYRTILKSPVSYQFIVPVEKTIEIINEINELYNKHFGLVKGKLPMHIGVIIQNYKFPLYLGIRALRSIRRDEKDIYDKIKYSSVKLDLESYNSNGLHDYYSYFETDGTGKFEFIMDGKKRKFNLPDSDEKFTYYPNTIDFEYLESNQRRYDIYYDKNAKRDNVLKNNRPYDLDKFLKIVKKYNELFGNKSSLIQNMVTLMMSRYEDWGMDKIDTNNNASITTNNKGNLESYAIFVKSTIKKYLKDDAKKIIEIVNYESNDDLEILKGVKMLFDLFDFIHRGLKE